jgi:CBS domain-containing protein
MTQEEPMTRVRDIMTPELVAVSPELPLRDLVEMLAQRHIGGVPVLAGSRVVGVVSMDDVMSFLSSQPVVPTVRPEDTDYDLEEPEAEAEEGEEAPGAYFADVWSDAGADVVERFAAGRGPEWDLLGEHVVAEAMSRRVRSIAPAADVVEAARVMRDAGVHRLLVMENGALLGIVTTTDVSNAVAAHRIRG